MSGKSLNAKVMAALEAVVSRVNPGVVEHLGVDSLTVWSEGGEWPSLDETGSVLPGVEEINSLPTDFVRAVSLDNAIQLVRNAVVRGQNIGIAMECATGKSTSLVADMYRSRLAPRIFVQQASHVPACELSSYMKSKYPDIVIDAPFSVADVTAKRGIYYMGPGVLTRLILSGAVRPTDLVVLDEAHAATQMHDVNNELLKRMPNRVVSMTASVSDALIAPRGVVVQEVDHVTAAVSDRLAQFPDQSLVLGVNDNMTYATPATTVVGMTCDARVVFDTGLRPDPRVVDGALEHGERLATLAETVQSVGRVGRLGKRGYAFVAKPQNTFLVQHGESLYDKIHAAFKVIINSGDYDSPGNARAKAIINSSGLVRGVSFEAGSKEYDGKRSSVDSAISVDSDVPPLSPKSSISSFDDDSGPPVGGSLSALGAVFDNVPVAKSTEARHQMQAKFEVEPHFLSPNITRMRVGYYDTDTRKSISRRNATMVDSHWSPRYLDSNDEQLAKVKSFFVSIFERLGEARVKGNRVRADPFPSISSDQVSEEDLLAAKAILDGSAIPTFAEAEVHAVLVWFNRRVASMYDYGCRLDPFTKYFRECDYAEYSEQKQRESAMRTVVTTYSKRRYGRSNY